MALAAAGRSAAIFRHETILSFVPLFAAMAERQIERWKAARSDGPVDAAAAMTRTTFDIIVESMLGGSASLDPERYSRALTENFDTIPWHHTNVQDDPAKSRFWPKINR